MKWAETEEYIRDRVILELLAFVCGCLLSIWASSLCIWHRPWHRPDVERRLNWPANVAHRQTKRRDNDSAQAELISLETPRSAKRRDA